MQNFAFRMYLSFLPMHELQILCFISLLDFGLWRFCLCADYHLSTFWTLLFQRNTFWCDTSFCALRSRDMCISSQELCTSCDVIFTNEIRENVRLVDCRWEGVFSKSSISQTEADRDIRFSTFLSANWALAIHGGEGQIWSCTLT